MDRFLWQSISRSRVATITKVVRRRLLRYRISLSVAIQRVTHSLGKYTAPDRYSSPDQSLKFCTAQDDASIAGVCDDGYRRRLRIGAWNTQVDWVRAMCKFSLRTICLCAFLATVNHLGAQAGKPSIEIGSAAVARAYVSYDRGLVDPSMALNNMSVLLDAGDARRADLEQFVASQQDPASQNYHRWLTPEQYAERFGASDATVARVTAWLQSQGMTDIRP